MIEQPRFAAFFSLLASCALSACEAPPTDEDYEAFDEPAEPRAWDSSVVLRPADPFQIRGETKLGCHSDGLAFRGWESLRSCREVDEFDPLELIDPLNNLDRYILLWSDTDGFVPIPRMKTKFQVDDQTEPLVAVTFSTMAWVAEQDTSSASVRVLIDGQDVADPGPVTFWSARPDPHRWAPTSFTFLVEATPGVHTVEVQYQSTGATIGLRDASLRVDVERLEQGDVEAGLFGESSTPQSTTAVPTTWKNLPGGGLDFTTGSGDQVLLTLSPTLASSGGGFSIRAVVDGVVASPSGFAFDGDQELAARSVSFVMPGLGAGNHHVDWQWSSTIPGDPATVDLEALTELAVVGPKVDPDYVVHTKRQSSGMSLVEDDNMNDPYRPIPGLTTVLDLDEISDAAITFTAHLSGDRVVFVAPTIDGEVLRDQEILFGAEAELNNGARSYTFALKDIPAGADTVLGLAVRSASGNPVGQSMLSSGTAGFLVKRRVGPDLAVGAKSGATSMANESIIEPVVGPRKVLAIAIDTRRTDAFVSNVPVFEDLLEQSIFGTDPSAANYLTAMSSGLASLAPTVPAKLYFGDAMHAGGDGTTNYYWDNSRHVCGGATSLYDGAASARWAKALLEADADIDFSLYDVDKDDVVEAHELAIVIYQIDDSNTGSSAILRFKPYCDKNQLFTLDGVRIREFSQINTPAPAATIPSESEKTQLAGVTMHELGHLLLGLDDVYFPFIGQFDPATGEFTSDPKCLNPGCETRRMNTDPNKLSLMSNQGGLPHVTAFDKLQLGWATPRIPISNGVVNLSDIAVDQDVLILPRRDYDAKEYFTLETRLSTGNPVTSKYDTLLGDSGLAVLHVIEPSYHCFDEGLFDDCRSLEPAQCVPEDMWKTYANNFARAGVRFLQQDLTHVAGSDTSLFNNGENLLEEAFGGGLTCPNPSQIGFAGGTSHLMWTEGEPSGYYAIDIDVVGSMAQFDLIVP
jgi:M6 family metalloprotease-like protein